MGEPITKKMISLNDLSAEDLELNRYRSLVNILNGYEEYLLNADGIIVSSNLETINVTGYEEWEIIGEHISKFYPIEEQLVGAPQKDLEKAALKGTFITTGLRVKKRNSSFWAKIKIKAVFAHEILVGYKMTLQDATHKAVSSHRLKKIKDEYLNLFNNSTVGLIKFSLLDFHILMINEKAAKIFDIEKERERFNSFFDDRDFQIFIRELELKKNIQGFEWKVANREQWVRISCRYFATGDFAEGAIVDITEFKKCESELTRVKHELDQFIYHASHELRAPLATMLGVINLISSDNNPDSLSNYCDLLKNKVHNLDNLLKSIVAISLNNKNPVTSDTIVWQELSSSILKEFANHPKIKTSFFIEQEYPYKNDQDRVRIILRNLISNSIKYLNPAADHPFVRIAITSNRKEAIIRIEDNGVGIDSEYVNEIFRMFYKATAEAKGHGLGLYTVKVMADKLNGRVLVESKLGEGSVFTLILPNEYNAEIINLDSAN